MNLGRPAVVIIAAALFCASIGDARALTQGENPSGQLAPYVSVRAANVAIVHVTVIDGTGKPELADQTVVFSKGVITAFGAASKVVPPAGASIIDGSGKTLMPGYVGLHNHLFTGTGLGPGSALWRSMPFSFPRLYLAAGTTTIRTTGSMDIYYDLSVKRAVDAGTAPGPHIDVTSPYLTGPGNLDPQMDELRDAGDARKTVDFWADHGVTSFKVYTDITHDALAAVIDEAHKRGLKVMGHLCSIGYREAAALGIDELEHGPFFTDTEFVDGKKADTCPAAQQDESNAKLVVDGPEMTSLIADFVARREPISSTLPVFESILPNSPPDAVEMATLDLLAPNQRAEVIRVRKILANPPPAFKARLAPMEMLMRKEMAFEVRFYRAGGILTAGPDPSGYGAVIAGLGDWREIELLVQAGLLPVEAIHVATQDGAIALGLDATIGTIAVGKNADLILVDGDPATKISDIQKVDTVFKDGVGYNSKKLFESVKGFVGFE
jgi:imidazolonepropionase-like amidohydrolase